MQLELLQMMTEAEQVAKCLCVSPLAKRTAASVSCSPSSSLFGGYEIIHSIPSCLLPSPLPHPFIGKHLHLLRVQNSRRPRLPDMLSYYMAQDYPPFPSFLLPSLSSFLLVFLLTSLLPFLSPSFPRCWDFSTPCVAEKPLS